MQVFNEVQNGNLERCLQSLSKYCDDIVIYDDASTDNSVEVARQYTDLIIEGKENNFGSEALHRQELLELALKNDPDWIFWIDADEIVEKRGEQGGIRELCENAGDFDCYAFHEVNLWRCENYYRIDNLYNEGYFCRLWKNTGELFIENKPGLHQRLVPPTLNREGRANLQIIHYGFASDENILRKYYTYKAHGQRGWALYRLIDERTLRCKKSNPDWFNNPPAPVTPDEVYGVPIARKV